MITLDGPVAHLGRALIDTPERLRRMDADGIDVQLLMVSAPGVQVFEPELGSALARHVNEAIAETIAAHPGRFAGLAAIAPQDPDSAVREVDRAIGGLGLHGVVVNSHTGGKYLDDSTFAPILAAIERHDVPLYIHPREVPEPMRPFFDAPVVAGATWEYGVEVGTHLLRMIGAGVFDAFPRLRVVVGHMGEGLPFWLDRIDNRFLASGGRAIGLSLLPSEYIRRNVWITTSGMNYQRPLQLAIDELGGDRILFAADYPFEDQAAAVDGLEQMDISAATKRAIFGGNARSVFRITM